MPRRWRPWLSLALLLALWRVAPAPADEGSWIAVVVPAALGQELDRSDLALIYRRKKLYAADGARLQPVNLPLDNPLRRRFSHAILGQSPESLEEYWNQQYFQGVLPPHVVASESAVQRFVAVTDHAVGYLPACAADASLRVVLLIDPDGRTQPPAALPACGP